MCQKGKASISLWPRPSLYSLSVKQHWRSAGQDAINNNYPVSRTPGVARLRNLDTQTNTNAAGGGRLQQFNRTERCQRRSIIQSVVGCSRRNQSRLQQLVGATKSDDTRKPYERMQFGAPNTLAARQITHASKTCYKKLLEKSLL